MGKPTKCRLTHTGRGGRNWAARLCLWVVRKLENEGSKVLRVVIAFTLKMIICLNDHRLRMVVRTEWVNQITVTQSPAQIKSAIRNCGRLQESAPKHITLIHAFALFALPGLSGFHPNKCKSVKRVEPF